METTQPTEQDIAYLKANPGLASKFDAHFGEGTSASILTPQPTEVAPTPAETSPAPVPAAETEVGAALPAEDEADRSTLADMAQGAVHGVQEAFNETVDALESADLAMSKKLDEWGIPSRLQILDQEGNLDVRLKTLAESEGDTDWLGGKTTEKGDAVEVEVVKAPVSGLGRFTSSTTQFLAGFAGARKITGLKGLWGAAVNGAFADGVVFDPEDANLSAFAEQNEYAVPFLTEALATDPEDPEWMNRMRNVTEGVLIGGAIDLTLKGLRGLALTVKGQRQGGDAGQALIDTGKQMVEETADAAEVARTEGLPLESAPDAPLELSESARVDLPQRNPLANPEAIKTALADKELVSIEQIEDSMWFNASKMDGPIEAKAMIEVAGDALARSGALLKLGLDKPQTHEALLKEATSDLANLTGGSLEGFNRVLAEMGESAADQTKFLITGKMALQSLGREVSKVAAKLDSMYAVGKIDPEVEAKLLDLMTTHTDLQGYLKQIQTSAARTTSAGRIRTTDGIDAAAMDALARVEAAGGSGAIQKAAKQLRLATTPEQQAALLRDMKRGSRLNRTLKVANEVFINNILSGWGTHAVNVASNVVNTAVLPMERIMGGALTGSRQQMREGFEQYVGLRSAVMDSLRVSGRVLKNEMPVLDTQIKLDNQAEGFQAITKENFGLESSPFGKLVDGIGSVVRIPGRFLMAEDEFFKQIMFRSRLKARLSVEAQALSKKELKKLGYDNPGAFIEGETRAATLTVQSLEDRWEDLVSKGRILDEPEAKAQFIRENLGAANEGSRFAADALRVSREATFTAPLKEGTLSHTWQKAANRHPILRQITPFIQTPVNILNKSFDRVPGVNVLRSRYRERLMSQDPNVRAEAAGEMATGVAISSALFMLAYEGRITGGGPLDGKTRQMWTRDSNWQPYSINLGTHEQPHWVEYRRFDPFAFTFGIAGDISEMIQASENDPSLDSAGMFAMLAAAVGNNLTSKTWLQGIADTVDVLESKQNPQVAQRWLERRVAAFVPYSSLGKTYNRAQDPFAKEARGYIDQIKMNVPGMSADLPDRYDWVSGEGVENPSKLLGFILASKGDGNTVSQELRRLQYGFTGPDRKIGKITLSSAQFQEWSKLMGTVQIGGKTLEQRLDTAIRSDKYDLLRKRVPDGITAPAESHRVVMLTGIIAGYKQKARGMLLEKHPELLNAWIEYEKYEADARRGLASPGSRENLLLEF